MCEQNTEIGFGGNEHDIAVHHSFNGHGHLLSNPPLEPRSGTPFWNPALEPCSGTPQSNPPRNPSYEIRIRRSNFRFARLQPNF